MYAYVILQPVKRNKTSAKCLLPFNTTSPERLQWPFCSTMVVFYQETCNPAMGSNNRVSCAAQRIMTDSVPSSDSLPQNTSFLLGWPIFRCYLSFREGKSLEFQVCFLRFTTLQQEASARIPECVYSILLAFSASTAIDRDYIILSRIAAWLHHLFSVLFGCGFKMTLSHLKGINAVVTRCFWIMVYSIDDIQYSLPS